MPEDMKRVCFVIGPIGDSESEARIHADWILEEIIQPVVAQFSEFAVVRANQIAPPGMIDAQVIQHLLDADLVIADLSKENPNAFYEIGIRHMAQKPIIHMQLIDEKIPFDVSLYRTIKFSRARPSDLKKAREDLKKAIDAVLADDYKVDNPVTRARGQIKIEQQATPEQRIVFEQLRSIQERLDTLEDGQGDSRLTHWARHQKVETVLVRLISKTGNSDIKTRIHRLISDIALPSSIPPHSDQVAFEIPATFSETEEWQDLRRRILRIKGVKDVDIVIPF